MTKKRFIIILLCVVIVAAAYFTLVGVKPVSADHTVVCLEWDNELPPNCISWGTSSVCHTYCYEYEYPVPYPYEYEYPYPYPYPYEYEYPSPPPYPYEYEYPSPPPYPYEYEYEYEYPSPPPPLPDLTVAPATPTVSTVGTATSFTATISNIGATSTGASFSNFFQIATAPGGGGTITDLTSISMSSLAASASAVATSPSYTFPFSSTYSVRACADKTDRNSVDPASGAVITESNEGNNCGIWANVVVNAAVPVPVVTISAAPTSGRVNVVNPTITWSATNTPTSCVATGDWTTNGAKATSGAQSQGVLTIVKTYTYTLTCSNVTGPSTPKSATVVVSASGAAILTSDKTKIYVGDQITLTWSCPPGGNSGVGTNFSTSGQRSGSVTITPPATTTYSILCSNGASASVTVTVKKRPGFIEN